MKRLQNYLFLSSLLIAFASCNHQREQQHALPTKEANTAITVPVAGTGGDAGIAILNNDYISSITQTFVAKASVTTLLTGRHGLKITVTPADLETVDGQPVTGDIVVKMTELINTDGLFKSNAATMSNGSFLVSGGSYCIGMQSNGKELRVKKGHAIMMQLPRIKENDMELFYGKRDVNNNMNWVRAEEPLVIRNAGFIPFNPPFPVYPAMQRFRSRFRMFESLSAKVFFMDHYITIKQMVEQLQRKGVDKNIDSIEIPWEHFYGRSYTANERLPYTAYIKRYRILSCQQIKEEHDSLARQDQRRKDEEAANKKYYEEWQKKRDENSVESQVQKYYAPVGVTSLGWINCDRFYNKPQDAEVPIEMPYTFNAPSVQYFLIYKKINGLMSGQIRKDANNQYALRNLPNGETVTLVVFAKNNGQLYQCKEDFVIVPGKKLKPNFTVISHEEITRMFGANVKI